jgi:Na+-driven multidrug efflux pump
MIPVGIAQASSIMVGNNIGAKDITAAKVYAKMCVLTAMLWAVAIVIFLNLMKGTVISVFSSNEAVNYTIGSAFPVLSLFVFFDCI